jgi:DNA-binding NarL/FixJ family response regulator
VAGGATNSEIATRLFISENTVKNHVGNILTKLNLRNRREAAGFAQRHGLPNSSTENLSN